MNRLWVLANGAPKVFVATIFVLIRRENAAAMSMLGAWLFVFTQYPVEALIETFGMSKFEIRFFQFAFLYALTYGAQQVFRPRKK